MAEYKIGCNFDFDLIDKIDELNQKSKNKITEFYGSVEATSMFAARPNFRLPIIDAKTLAKFVKKSRKKNIEFNYTLNSIFIGSKREIHDDKIEYALTELMHYLEEIGVERVTVSNPLVLEIVRRASKIKIELSTIMHIDTVTQVKYLNEKYDIDKVCGNLLKNRNITFLMNLAKYCNANNITLDLMTNEFCGVGSELYATHCPYRDSCYLCHATDETKEDAELYNRYPMNRCINSRDVDPSCWLKMRFIRPEDIERYENIGIKNFKITGRTGSTDYIMSVAKAYCDKSFDGNLLSLWKQLDTIYTNENELQCEQPTYIDNKSLDGFIDMWFDKDWRCDEKDCGVQCTYCNDFYYDHVDKKGDK